MADDPTFQQIIDGLSAPIATTTADEVRARVAHERGRDSTITPASLGRMYNKRIIGIVIHPDDFTLSQENDR